MWLHKRFLIYIGYLYFALYWGARQVIKIPLCLPTGKKRRKTGILACGGTEEIALHVLALYVAHGLVGQDNDGFGSGLYLPAI